MGLDKYGDFEFSQSYVKPKSDENKIFENC